MFCAHQRPIVFYHTPSQCPPHDTGHCVNTVTLAWVGAPNERTPFRSHDAVVGFVDRGLSRTRNLAASNQTSALSFLKPIFVQYRPQNCFFRVFPKVWNFPFQESCSYQPVPASLRRVSLEFIFSMETLRFSERRAFFPEFPNFGEFGNMHQDTEAFCHNL